MPDRNQLFWLFFRFSGRVSRAAYFLAGLLLAIVQVFLLYRFTLVPQDSTQGQFWAMAFWAAVLALFWFSHGVMVAWSRPMEAGLATIEIVLALVVILAASLPGLRARFGGRR